MIGLGLIGGSLGLALKKSGCAKSVIGWDLKKENLETAYKLNLIDQKAVSINDTINSDLVIVATPVNLISEIVSSVLSQVPLSTSVMDVGSTKANLALEINKHDRRGQFVSVHPMAGTENSGPAAALADLFLDKTVVICDANLSGENHLKKIESALGSLKMRILKMTSEEHDLRVAFVSHLSHVSSFILANTVLDLEKNVATIFDLASGGFESTVRLAKSSPEMWAPIFEQNRENVGQALEAYILRLQEFKGLLENKNWPEVVDRLKKANGIRRVLDSIQARVHT
jgi:prephenate dehydrogenase